MRPSLWVLFCLFVFSLIGCAGSAVVGGGGPVGSLKITPNPITLKPNEKIQLTAILDGGSAPVTWAVNTVNGGTITQGGVYTAPVASGTYEVQVALASDPSKFGKANAVIDSGYEVVITAPPASQQFVPYGGTLQLSAKVQGSSSNNVTWSTDKGSIDANGLFTATSVTEDAVVTAVSTADTGKKSTMTLHIVPPVQIVGQATPKLSIPRGYFNFTALVNGIASSDVDWTTTSGTINTSGKWTADNSFNGDVTITATSKTDGTKSASTTVTVVPNLNVRFKFLTLGDVVFALRPDKAPNTSANLVSLANAKFYDGILVHRYEAGFVVQWGDPLTLTKPLTDPSIGTGGPGYTIDFEANDLLHLHYSLAMARAGGLNTAGSQIYVCLADQPSLDGSYVVFGSVQSGTSVVDALRKGDKIVTASVELP